LSNFISVDKSVSTHSGLISKGNSSTTANQPCKRCIRGAARHRSRTLGEWAGRPAPCAAIAASTPGARTFGRRGTRKAKSAGRLRPRPQSSTWLKEHKMGRLRETSSMLQCQSCGRVASAIRIIMTRTVASLDFTNIRAHRQIFSSSSIATGSLSVASTTESTFISLKSIGVPHNVECGRTKDD